MKFWVVAEKQSKSEALPSLEKRHCALIFPPAQVQRWPRFERTSQPCLDLDEPPPAAAAERPASHYDTLPRQKRGYSI